MQTHSNSLAAIDATGVVQPLARTIEKVGCCGACTRMSCSKKAFDLSENHMPGDAMSDRAAPTSGANHDGNH